MSTFSDRLKGLVEQGIRDGLFASQADAARRLGYSEGRFGHWCTGYTEPNGLDEFSRLAEGLRTHPNYLLGWSDDPRPDFAESVTRMAAIETDVKLIKELLAHSNRR